MGDKGEGDDQDQRLEFILAYLSKSYKLKQEKWNKMMADSDMKKIIMNFLNKPEEKMMILTIAQSGQLTPLRTFSPVIKSKFTYFIRKKSLAITIENFRDVVTFGDMAARPVEELSVLVNGVLLPVLSNPMNQRGWPKIVAEDVGLHVEAFRNQVDQIRGCMRSETILTMPTGIASIYEAERELAESNGEKVNVVLKCSLEAAVFKWQEAVTDLCAQTPLMAFEEHTNPLPNVEIDFWTLRLNNMESLYDQLRDPRIKKIALYLEGTNSAYVKSFKDMFKQVVDALIEARDVVKYLKALSPALAFFDDSEFMQHPESIKGVFHTVALLWANSKYYCTSERIVTLITEITNQLISACETALEPDSIFQGEASETFQKVMKCMEVIELYQESFEMVRNHLQRYAPKQSHESIESETGPDSEPKLKPWLFHRRNVFQRLIEFTERLNVVKDIIKCHVDFEKLEKVEIGGLRGRILSVKVEEVFEEFMKSYSVFQNIQYEVMDLKDDSLLKDADVFFKACEDYDRRLSSCFVQAFGDCHNMEAILKFLIIVGPFLEREMIEKEMRPLLREVVDVFDQELDVVKVLYDEAKTGGVPLDKYYSRLAGTVLWLHKLYLRISKPGEELVGCEVDLVHHEKAEHVLEKYEEMKRILVEERDRVFGEWVEWVPGQIGISVVKPRLVRDGDNLIRLNFDGELEMILRDVRYLKLMEMENVPQIAQDLFSRFDELNFSLTKYKRIVEWYNYLRTKTLKEESDIIHDEMTEIDSLLTEALDNLNWTQQDHDYVQSLFDLIKGLYDRLKLSQDNIHRIEASIDAWATVPQISRKDNRKENLLAVEERLERTRTRNELVKASCVLLERVLKDNKKLLLEPKEPEPLPELSPPEPEEPPEPKGKKGKKEKKKKKPKKTPEEIEQELELIKLREDMIKARNERLKLWEPYLDYLHDLVKNKMVSSVLVSLKYLLSEMGDLEPITPFFELSMELHEPNIVFIPSCNPDDIDCFHNVVEDLMQDMVLSGTHLKLVQELAKDQDQEEIVIQEVAETEAPVAEAEVEDEELKLEPQSPRASEDGFTNSYYHAVLTDETMNHYYYEILHRIDIAMEHAKEFTRSFDNVAELWQADKQEYLRQFLLYGRALTDEELEMLNNESGEIKENPPVTFMFRDEIDKYQYLYNEIEKIPGEQILEGGWLRLDVKPLRQALLNTVCKWSNLFKQHLYNRVLDSLENLEEFIKEAIKAMQVELTEDDYDGLIEVMGWLFKVKERQLETDTMFEPLKEIVDLLKEYGMEFPEEIHVQLQEIPDRWIQCKKVAAGTKQAVVPFQAIQVNAIKRRITLFEIRQKMCRDRFKALPVFNWGCEKVYALLDKTNKEVEDLEAELAELQDQSALFELQLPEFKPMKQVRVEVRKLKQLWDYVNIVMSCVDEWKGTLWIKIDVEAMEMECKKFGKELRQMDKDLKILDVFVKLEAEIKNMLTSLRAVTELQNPAIRERHWQQLMQATKVRFVMDDSTTLKDLLDLNLHEYEEEVKTIVDKSVKEMAMEKVLKELYSNWTDLVFNTTTHDRTRITLVSVPEEVLEMLEENQVALQNMMTSKFIAFFLEEVSEWQRKLSNVDQVITVLFEVQRKWGYLESIFVGSEDIRNQLPEESKRFDRIDRQFKDVIKEVVQISNIVKACNKPGLYDFFDGLLSDLTICEKALNDYLETKRLVFPRFYFVSSADLLDILSNGNAPDLVCRHLSKLFNSLAKIRFVQEGGKNTKKGKSMIAKDGEEIPFAIICDCTGKVEVWLNRVIDVMKKTLRDLYREAVVTYDEKPRELWIYDYPNQVSLCGTQIWWSTEVDLAFAKLEEGYENALKDYQKKQIAQLNALIQMLLADLTPGDRQKVMTICTIDVHARDVVGKMIQIKVESGSSFQWKSQLRHRWDEIVSDCFANICDAEFLYFYEYLGNTPRLVITPLTDRCYITITQSLHLIMGAAPAGPAGTGKTESTKDLGKALGMMVYVFNCSEQMDYRSLGNIFKGLAQSGTWGCFDEFNRISIEVLSVVAEQVKCILDGLKYKKTRFNFVGEEINLAPSVGMYITMNPGYAGRTELPENVKSLFRPCAMVVPDFELICEIMLVAQGFLDARLLARKFITLYTLCRELLSKQDHYDWGLRAIKSVLVVAGSLKRADKQRPEDQVLMRALRDFNIPKIITDDVPVFMGLIGDLFPALDVPRKRDLGFEKIVRQSALDLKLQPEEGFVLKVVQLQELLEVRHSVFIIGFAGTGKSMVWKNLFKTYQNQKLKPFYNDLNPKAVTNDELFGVINPATREWKDGLFSVIMRDQTNLSGDGPKWIVLDGDIDPMWIESLNTLMDDNRILTLASNERIALTPVMRLIFEIADLKTATPATVSRAGILYINISDVGWNPYIASWVESRELQSEKANLTILFDKYVPPCLEAVRKKFKKITPISDIAHLQMLCYLLDCLLTPINVPLDCPKEWYEIYFVFSTVWAFGSAMFQDQIIDWRNEFSKWFVNEFKTVKFPIGGNVFSYYIEDETKRFAPWTELLQGFTLDHDLPIQAMLVNTDETTRIAYFMNLLMSRRAPVMLIGGAGCGKTTMVKDRLNHLPDKYSVQNVPFNFYTTSEMLQKVLEKPLEKKAGRVFAPPGNTTMVYFIDDMNMPEVDKYFTVQPHTLLRQFMDYQHWYDRAKLTLKDIHNIQFVSCMNPTAGSFTINPRLQRHFCSFAVSQPSTEDAFRIYNSILGQHLETASLKFPKAISSLSGQLVHGALALQAKVQANFLPTAIKFHYIFNLRDLSNIFQGMLYTTTEFLKQPSDLVRVWLHEARRVYSDKLVERKDIDAYNKVVIEVFKQKFEEMNEAEVFTEPLIYCHFAQGIGDPKYNPIKEMSTLQKLLGDALSGYNDLVAAMDMVLFEDAMNHICRINRIMEAPRGNALLVGVGGSGMEDYTRLSAFISGFDVFQIQLRKGYNMTDMKADISTLYLKAGIKGVGIVFLMTDAQIPEESFLVVVNDMLASGEVYELLPDEEVENVINAMRGDAKALGIEDTRENCWKLFIEKVRKLLKIILCFSPVGSTLRVRARKFPALVNSTSIDWFHEWPKEALISVSKRFLEDIKVLPVHLIQSISSYMSHVHSTVNEMSHVYLMNEKRYNYTTPRSFTEQIALYSKLLTEKTNGIYHNITRLENGLTKLASTSEEVDGLKDVLAVQEVELGQKNEAASKLIAVLSVENEKVAKEQAVAAEEEAKVRVIEEDVSAKAAVCAADLAKAEPALIAAQEALNTLNKNNLTELKSFASPPEAVERVCAAVLVLFSKKKLPKDRSWKAAKAMMARVDQFLFDLINYDKENMSAEVVKATMEYTKHPEFKPEIIMSKSFAAAGLCSWVINILAFYEVFVVVEPKRKALAAANQELNAARQKLAELNVKLQELEAVLSVLRGEFEEAVNAKLKCQAEADATAQMIDLANRLVNGLASENVRWRDLTKMYRESIVTLPGDCLLITSFISYVGSFSRRYRDDLLKKHWMPYLGKLAVPIPMTPGVDPLGLLTDNALVAQWNNEGLPTDRMSTENACILVNSSRWPLIIDPQLQGIKWIKNRYSEVMRVVRPTQKNYIDVIVECVTTGSVCIVENLGETIEPVLDPIIGRILIKKGTCVRVGDKEVDWDNRFRLLLHTKLANPHYQPEIQAQTTLINFTVTRDGLEEQLLADVVKAERPDLEQLKSELTKQQNDFKITIKQCEDNLLYRLSSATGNILGDVALVENLENTKRIAKEIEEKSEEAKITSAKIDEAREQYRPCATRASILYFILNDLFRINAIYQFSLKAFSVVFIDALKRAVPAEKLKDRVVNLLDSITFSVFMYTSRGLFEADKLIFLAQTVFQIYLNSGDVNPIELDFLLRFPAAGQLVSPVEFLSNLSWGGIKALSEIENFKNLDKDLEGSAKRWQKFVDSECPEKEKFPGEWKGKTTMQRLCIMRALRPDRMTYAVTIYIEEKMGTKYITARSVEFKKSYEETSAQTPVFFILSPGVNPLKDVEKLGKELGFAYDNNNFHSVSLGQGQEQVAENKMDLAAKEGHWVILQNIHLVVKWLATLEKKMEQCADSGHPNYRLYLSAEPSGNPLVTVIPQGILESSIKITNEPPTGMFANVHKALDNFNQDTLEMCSKEAEFKGILFSLCYFHAVVIERKKFGPQGWNRDYPYNVGDLTISVNVLYNYLENNAKVPWEDLRYLFGEIMYGGHITDGWDRRLCSSYLLEYMQPELIDGELFLAPGFRAPPNTDYEGYHRYIDEWLPPESPYLYGLHPNAEIGFLASTSERMFKTIFEMQPRDAGSGGGGGVSHEEKVKGTLDEILDKLPEMFPVAEMYAKVEEKTPYIIVIFQECERMNILVGIMRTSLKELDLGLKGELTITSDMEALDESIFMDVVPEFWAAKAYASLLPLGQWVADLQMRVKELESWINDFSMPATVWLGGFFNPQSFLTAIMQQTARKNEWPLDKMCLMTDVTKKQKEEFNSAPREGAYVCGLFMEGARWDTQINSIGDSKLKDLFPTMPVIFIKAITQDKQDLRNMYDCPVYKTRQRGPTFVWTFNLKTKEKSTKWTLAGVALLLQI